MEAIRVKRRIESETLVIPDLKKMIGKNVEIILLVEPDEHMANRKQKGLGKFFGKWKDDRKADEIISEIREDRSANIRSEKVEL